MAVLEDALVAHEAAQREVVRLGKNLARALKGWEQATHDGNLGDIRKFADQASELVAKMAEPVNEASSSWTFDAGEYLKSDEWLNELADWANRDASGVRAFSGTNELVCPPVAVRADANRGSLKLGRKAWKKLRPSKVVAELKRLAEAGSGNDQAFLEVLHNVAAYIHRTGKKETGLPATKLRDIFEVLSLNPNWKKENSDLSFAQALYSLHNSEARVTRAGRKFEFEFPSGQPKSGDVFAVVAEDGRTIRYYMIHFR